MAEFYSIHQVSRNVLVIIGCVLLWGPLYTYIIFNDIDVCPKCLAGNSLAFATYVLIGLLAYWLYVPVDNVVHYTRLITHNIELIISCL